MRASSAVGELDGRELLVADQRGDLERGPPGEILVDHGVTPPTLSAHCIIRLVSGGRPRRGAPRRAAAAASASATAAAETVAPPHLDRRWRAGANARRCGCPTAPGSSIDPRAAHDPRWGASDARCASATRHAAHPLRGGRLGVHRRASPRWPSPRGCRPAPAPRCSTSSPSLAADQGRGPLAYAAPTRPSSSSWRCSNPSAGSRDDDARDDPLAAFMAGGLRWTPAPFTRAPSRRTASTCSRASASRRSSGAAAPTTGPTGRASSATRPTACTTSAAACTCSLWALGRRAGASPGPDAGRRGAGRRARRRRRRARDGALAPAVAAGLVAVVVAASAPPLAAAIRDGGRGPDASTWAPLTGDLAVARPPSARICPARLRRALAARVTAADEPRRAGAARLRRARRAGAGARRCAAGARAGPAGRGAARRPGGARSRASAVGRGGGGEHGRSGGRSRRCWRTPVSCWRER